MKLLVATVLVTSLAAWGCSSSDDGGDSGGKTGGSGGSTTTATNVGGNTSSTGFGTGGTTVSGGGTSGTSTVTLDECGVTAAAAIKVTSCPGDIAWYSGNIASVKTTDTYPVEPGKKTKNGFGLYDILGNAAEWTQDYEHITYDGAPTDGSAWTTPVADYYIVRGGCVGDAETIRVSVRTGVGDSGYGACQSGVRCVRASGTVLPTTAKIADPTWVSIPAGKYTMGCSPGDAVCEAGAAQLVKNELPRHCVTVAAFDMMVYEATQEQVQTQTGQTDWPDGGCPKCAASLVTHTDAQAFCEALGGRLPTEAEWEYAARASTTTAFYCGTGS